MQRILSIIGWIGTAIVGVAVAARVLNWVGAIAIQPEQDRYIVWAAWAGLACVLLYTAGQWREILAYFGRRQARYGAIATVGVVVGLLVLVAVNYLSTRTSKRWDLTQNRQNSLSEQTVKVLQSLTAPVKFTVFDQSTNFDRFRTRLDEYAYNSKQVSVEYVDPDARPVVAREYDIDTYGTVVVDYMGRRERATSDQEQDITNALIKAVSGMERAVYFVQGHGEKNPTGTARDGYSAVTDALKRDNYKVEPLVLAQQKDVPADATVLIVAGPTSDLLPEEADAIRRYLAKAGKLMVLVDPVLGSATALPNLEALIREWNIDVGNNVVVDVSGATNEPSIAVAATYPPHAITDRFATLTVYPLARSVTTLTTTPGRSPLPLVETSQASWAETDIASLNGGQAAVKPEPEKGDIAGPVTIAAAVSALAPDAQPAAAQDGQQPAAGAPMPETRVVVFGDSDFASNAYAGLPGNPNLFANTVNWLSQQENLIAIRPTQAADRRVTMTAGEQRMAFLLSVFIVPLAVFGAGVFTWWRRR
jgi:ABC-type uncharacterized transport system involved in gliding motility auxiliary subunit